MNTLLPTALNQSGIPVGLAAAPRLPDLDPTPSNTGFLSLINVLLSFMEPMPPAAPNAGPLSVSPLNASNTGVSNAPSIVPQSAAPPTAPPPPLAPPIVLPTLGKSQPQPAQPEEVKDGAEAGERTPPDPAAAAVLAPLAWVFLPVPADQLPAPVANTSLSALPIFLKANAAAALAERPVALTQTVIVPAIPLQDAVQTGPLGSPQLALSSPPFLSAAAGPAIAVKSPVRFGLPIFRSRIVPVGVLVPAELAPAAAGPVPDQSASAPDGPRLSPCSRPTPFAISAVALAPASAPVHTEPASTLRPAGLEQTEVLILPEDSKVEPRRLAVSGAELAFSAHLTPLIPAAAGPAIAPGAGGQSDNPVEPPRASEPAREVPGNAKTTWVTREDRDNTAPLAATAAAWSGTLPEHTGDFARALDTHVQTPPAPERSIGPAVETPFRATAEAIRTAEPVSLAAWPHSVLPAHEISVRIAQPDTPAIDLHVVQRSGQVQVAVRTPDAALQSSLRQDLSTLVSALEHAGYRAETFAPRDAAIQKTTGTEMSSPNSRQDSRPDSSNRGFGDSSHGRQHQRQRDPRPSAWLADLEQPA